MCPAPSADRSVVSKPWRERARLRRRFQATQPGHRRQGRGQGQESSSSRGGSPFSDFQNCAAPILPFQRRVGNEESPPESGVFPCPEQKRGRENFKAKCGYCYSRWFASTTGRRMFAFKRGQEQIPRHAKRSET